MKSVIFDDYNSNIQEDISLYIQKELYRIDGINEYYSPSFIYVFFKMNEKTIKEMWGKPNFSYKGIIYDIQLYEK